MRIGTDGSIDTPDPDVVVTLTPEDVGTVIEALRVVMCASDPRWDERRRVALEKFELLRDDQEDGPDAFD